MTASPAPLGLCAFATTTFVLSMCNVDTRGLNSTPNIVVGMAFFYGVCFPLVLKAIAQVPIRVSLNFWPACGSLPAVTRSVQLLSLHVSLPATYADFSDLEQMVVSGYLSALSTYLGLAFSTPTAKLVQLLSKMVSRKCFASFTECVLNLLTVST